MGKLQIMRKSKTYNYDAYHVQPLWEGGRGEEEINILVNKLNTNQDKAYDISSNLICVSFGWYKVHMSIAYMYFGLSEQTYIFILHMCFYNSGKSRNQIKCIAVHVYNVTPE